MCVLIGQCVCMFVKRIVCGLVNFITMFCEIFYLTH